MSLGLETTFVSQAESNALNIPTFSLPETDQEDDNMDYDMDYSVAQESYMIKSTCNDLLGSFFVYLNIYTGYEDI